MDSRPNALDDCSRQWSSKRLRFTSFHEQGRNVTEQYTHNGRKKFPSFKKLFKEIDSAAEACDRSNIDPDDENLLTDPAVYRILPVEGQKTVDTVVERCLAYEERRDASPIEPNFLPQAKSAIKRAGGRIVPVVNESGLVVAHQIVTPGGSKIEV